MEEYSPQPPCWLKLEPKKTFLIADPHLGHKNLVKLSGRPEDFTERILNSLSNLPSDSTLVVLGDLALSKSWAKKISIAPSERKILVKGNHDRIRHYGLDKLFDVICLAGYSRVPLKKNITVNVYFYHYPVPASKVEKSIGYHVDFVVSGHTHKPPFYDPKTRIVNLSPEVVGYEPMKMDKLLWLLMKNLKEKIERII